MLYFIHSNYPNFSTELWNNLKEAEERIDTFCWAGSLVIKSKEIYNNDFYYRCEYKLTDNIEGIYYLFTIETAPINSPLNDDLFLIDYDEND